MLEEQRDYEGVFVVVFFTAAFFLATFFLVAAFLGAAAFFAAFFLATFFVATFLVATFVAPAFFLATVVSSNKPNMMIVATPFVRSSRRKEPNPTTETKRPLLQTFDLVV